MPRQTAQSADHTRNYTRPAWPHPNIVTMFPHQSGQWAKKIRGRTRYFGRWDEPDLALARWEAVGEDLLAGREPQAVATPADVLTLHELANAYMAQVSENQKRGRVRDRHPKDVYRTVDQTLAYFGPGKPVHAIEVADWTRWANKLRERWNDVTFGNHVKRVRTMFRWAYESGLIDKPMRYGPEFKPGGVKRSRRETFTPDDILTLIDHASAPMRAMVLLGINGGYGNTDCSALTEPMVRGGAIEGDRHKTQVPRCVPLWPETATAITKAIAARPRPMSRSYAAHVFLTKRGQPWVDRGRSRDAVSQQFGKLAKACGVPSLGFYSLRRTFRTVADGAGDQRAADVVMGHVTPGMSGVYVQSVERSRLEKVVGHVHDWLWCGK